MNPTGIPTRAAAIAALLFAVVIPIHAVAGSQTLGKADASVAKAADQASPALVCTGAKTVPITMMRPALPNGKGPLMPVQIGSKTKTVCYQCPVTTTVTKNAWPNNKGPLTATKVTKTGVEHRCIDCGPNAKS
ncbi:MAG: hypothetical protein ACOZE5_14480 [Verrucomicrobiota bacterium]